MARGIILLIRIVGFVPFEVRSLFGYIIGYLFSFIPTRDGTFAKLQLRYFLGQSNDSIFRGVYGNLGRGVFESLNLAPLKKQLDSAFDVEGLEVADPIMKRGKGMVVLTGHTGNWDLLAAWTIMNGFKLSTIGKEAKSPLLQDVLSYIRESYGINTIWRSDKSAIRKIISRLKDNELVSALIDQDTSVGSLFPVFFNTPAATPSTLVEIGKKAGAGFVSAFIVRASLFRFRVIINSIDSSLTCEEILAEYSKNLEDVIRRYPSQWVWFHKRWRTQPDGYRRSSKEYLNFLRSSNA